MKKLNFFTKEFLDECERQLEELQRQIELPEHALTPVNFSDEEKIIAKKFHNRVLYLLFQGGRICSAEYFFHFYFIE